MRSEQIFISYRRDDAAGYARAVYDELARQFGEQRVFIDVDDIGAGQAFSQVIEQAVGSAEVLLVLIGSRWLGPRPGRAPRLADAGDFVRLEVAAALAKGMRVLPVLLDGTPMPDASQLPPDVRELTRRNAVQLDNTRFAADMRRLVAALQPLLSEAAAAEAGPNPEPAPATSRSMPMSGANAATPPLWRRRGVRLALLAGAALLLVNGVLIWSSRLATTAAPASAAKPLPTAAARPPINGRWQAEVVYDWPNANFSERFEFSGEGQSLQGSASYLRVPRGLLQGRLDNRTDGPLLQFQTQSTEQTGDSSRTVTHHYQGRLENGLLQLTMQTEGSSSAHVPVKLVARPLGGAP